MSIRMRFVLVGGVLGHSSMVTVLVFDHRRVNTGCALIEDLPDLPESQSAVAVWVARATVARVARENLMVKRVQ
jgi:hypothetical protein